MNQLFLTIFEKYLQKHNKFICFNVLNHFSCWGSCFQRFWTVFPPTKTRLILIFFQQVFLVWFCKFYPAFVLFGNNCCWNFIENDGHADLTWAKKCLKKVFFCCCIITATLENWEHLCEIFLKRAFWFIVERSLLIIGKIYGSLHTWSWKKCWPQSPVIVHFHVLLLSELWD